MNGTRKTLQDYNVQANDYVLVEGTVNYSRIGNKIDGEELAQRIQKAQRNGWIPPTGPYYTITLDNPKIINKVPGQESPMEQYFRENRIYTSQKTGVPRCTVDSKSPFPPEVKHLVGNQFFNVDLAGKDLATGSKVRIMINAYASKYGRVGSGLAGIIVMDNEVKFYQSGSRLTSMLEGFGFTNSGENTSAMTEVEATVDEDIETTPIPEAPAANPYTPPQQTDPSMMNNPWDNPVGSGNPFNR